MHEAWSPTTLTTGKESGYGYGWFVATVNGELQLRHHGESTGFTNGDPQVSAAQAHDHRAHEPHGVA